MKTILEQRRVARIESPEPHRGMSDVHQVRPLISPGQWAATDPFLLLMEDWFPVGVFDRHPHRGMETVTYVLDGTVEHYDNHGHKGNIEAGDAMWMTAGKGLIHNEQPAPGQTVHLLQLWINLPSTDKLVQAHHQTLHAASLPVRREAGAEIRVFSGKSGSAEAATTNHTPVTMVELRLEPHAQIEQEIPAGFNAFVVVLGGGGKIASSSTDVKVGNLVWLTPNEGASTAAFAAGEEGLRALLFAGKPLHEPVAARGPFVMNTEEELEIGFAEYRAQGEQFGR
jgi:redox-sensitive bicupin YhaK (pirin superfamily)